MRRKVLLVAILIFAMLLQCVMPLVTVNASTSVAITLNSNLYKAVKSQLRSKGIAAEYMDANGVIVISQDELKRVTELDLSCAGIDDLDNGLENVMGIQAFTSLEKLDLHGNYLTEDSHLNLLDNFAKLKEIDLSTNQIASVKSISTFHNPNKKFDITEQKITGRTIISIDDSEESENRYTRAIVNLPDILLETEEGFDPYWIWSEDVRLTRELTPYEDTYGYITTPEIDYENSFGSLITDVEIEGLYDCTDENASAPYPYMIIKVAEGVGLDYHTLKGLIKFKIEVNNSRSILKDSEIVWYYAVVDEEETGITFDDGNLYRALKEQLTQYQGVNYDLTETTNYRNLYQRAYDEAFILVIDTNDIINNIPTLILHDQKITDLKGIEDFVGLKSYLDVSYNYISTIERIVELEENKIAKEQELRERYNKFLTKLKENVQGYDAEYSKLKAAVENWEKARDELAGITDAEARIAKLNEIQGYLDEISEAQAAMERYEVLIKKYTAKLYQVYEKEYKMVSLLPAKVNYLSYGELLSANLETVKGYANSIMERVSALEKTEALTEYEYSTITDLMSSWASNNRFEFKTEKLVYVADPSTGDPEERYEPIEYPISEFFEEVQKDSTLTIIDYEEFVYIFKCIDALSQVEQYTLIKRMFENTDANYAADAIDEIQELYWEKGYDTFFYDKIWRNSSYCNISTGFGDMVINIYLYSSEYTGYVDSDYALSLAHRQALITQEDIETYITLPRIERLRIEDNKVGSLAGIEELTELQELEAWKNMINNLSNVNWSQFKQLYYLDLGYNQISDISPLQVLLDLRGLDVSYNLLSGKFTFRLINMRDLYWADFSHNQYSDIQYANDQYVLKAMGYDVDGDGTADGLTVPEYLDEAGIMLSFQYQTLEMSTVIIKTNEDFVEIELPLIFRQLEKIDHYRTSFGVDSLGGLVEPEGTSVKLRVPSVGEYQATVNVEGYNGEYGGHYDYSRDDGIGYGTTCTIKYKVVDGSGVPSTPVTPVTPNNPTGTGYGYPVENGYVYVAYPETTVSQFINQLVDTNSFDVNITDNKSSEKIGTGSVATITNKADGTVYAILEVVVKGDLNGDGEVDALDSGIIRTVINDTATLVGVYEAAADVNSDGDIDSQDSILILQYRADRISNFAN